MSNQLSSKPLVKPLKGGSVTSNFGSFDTINANSVTFESMNVAGVFEDGEFFNIIIKDSELINTVIGIDGPNVGYFTTLQTSADVSLLSNISGAAVTWDPVTAEFHIASSQASFVVDGCSFLGNLEICQNFIKATNLNGDVQIIPDNLGTIYLQGPVNNVSSNGSFYTELSKGAVSFIVDKNITLYSSHGSANITTELGQNYSTINGDLTLSVDTGATTKSLTNVRTSGGNIFVTSDNANQVKIGDIVSITNGSLSGNFTVGNVINDRIFTLTTTTGNLYFTTGGSLLKSINNNIVLNSQNLVKIPSSTRLSFGDTTNSISGTTSGLTVSSVGDVAFNVGTSNVVEIPQTTKLQFGTSGNNYINHNGSSLSLNSTNTVDISGSLTSIDTTNTKLYDPIITLANYNLSSNDGKDRGVEFKYFDTTSNSMKLGWFGFQNSTNSFAFIGDATNNNEVISGNYGNLQLGSLQTTNLTLNSNGVFDVNCGKLLNVNLITGCGNTVNISGSTNVNVNATNRISLNAGVDVLFQNNVPVKYGTAGSYILENTSNNLVLTAYRNTVINTNSKGSIIIPIETSISFDGTSIGSQNIASNTSGDLLISSNKGIFLTTTGGNIVIPSNTPIQLGAVSQTITGSSAGINMISSSTNSFSSFSDTNINSSNGNINLFANTGDVNLYTSTGNVRILPNKSLVFNTSGSNNSILNSNGTFLFTGSSSNTVRITNISSIDLLASNNIDVPTNTLLNVGASSIGSTIFSDNSAGTWIVNSNTNGSISVLSKTTNLVNTSGNLNVLNTNTNITTSSFVVSGNTVQLNTDNVRIKDPIVTIGDQTLTSSDQKDRGIEYRYYSTSGSMKLGWFGRKDTSNRFTLYSDAINTSEVITGTLGDLEVSNAYLRGGLNFIGTGFLDLACGTMANVNTIIGCSGVINMNATSGVNVNTGTFNINATNRIQVPYNIPLSFGNTSNNIVCDTTGTLTVTSKVIFSSDVQINGTSTTVYSTVTNIQDPIISIGGVTGPLVNDGKDRGIEFKWSDGTISKTGFFGYKNNIGRFVFIKDGTNNNEVFSGAYGDVQFGDGYFTNLNLSNGQVTGVNTLSGGAVNIFTTVGNLSLTPTSGNSVLIPYNIPLSFGNTQNSIMSDTSGNMIYTAKSKTTILSQTGGISFVTSDSLRAPSNVPLYFGTTNNTYIINDSSGNLSLLNSTGNVNLTPKFSTGSVNIPTNNYLNFGSSSNSVYSDGTQLILNGLNGIAINSSSVTIAGTVNVVGTLSASNTNVDLNQYILPLGTNQYLPISSVVNNPSGSGGNILVTTTTSGYLSIGDSVTLQNTNTTPIIDGNYTITSITSPTSFTITGSSLNTGSSVGSVKTNLTTDPGKDVGIQVNYWSTTGNTSTAITVGSVGYKTGFFGFKKSTERWSFYANVTNSNNVVTGSLGDIEVNKVFATRMSGFGLDGAVSCGSNNVSGTSFTIGGGSINATPIGTNSASTGRFTTLSNTVQASLTALTLQSTLGYSIERYTLNSTTLQFRSPSDSTVVSLFSVVGASYTTSSGTMPSTSIPDGTMKILMCSSMGTGCQHTIYFGNGKLITPTPLSGTGNPTTIVFKRKGQSAQLLFDAVQGGWILLGSGAYVN